MKKSALITVILLFNCLTFLGQTNKLPIPTKSFIEKAKKSSDMEALYFTKYLGKKSERIIERYDSKSVCSKEYEFKTGIRYKTNSCNETSIEAEIIFPNYSKNDVVKFVILKPITVARVLASVSYMSTGNVPISFTTLFLNNVAIFSYPKLNTISSAMSSASALVTPDCAPATDTQFNPSHISTRPSTEL